MYVLSRARNRARDGFIIKKGLPLDEAILFLLWCIVLQTNLARTISDTVDYEPIIVKIVSLRNIREVTAGRKVEYFTFLIADKCDRTL